MEWIEIVYKIISGIIIVLSVVLLFVKNNKTKQKISSAIQTTSDIFNIVQTFMADAETYEHYNGNEKHQFVFTRVKDYAQKNKIEISDNLINELITTQAQFSKLVNNKKVEE